MAYQPVNEQEHVDRELILGRLAHDPHVADRSSLAHLTTSAWTVDAAGERVLLCYHNIYDSWSWVGMRTASLTLPPSRPASSPRRRA